MRGDRIRTTHYEAGVAIGRRAKAAHNEGRNEESLNLYRQAHGHFVESSDPRAARLREQCRQMIVYFETGSIEQVVAKPVPLAKAEPDFTAADLLESIRADHAHPFDAEGENRKVGSGRG